MTSVPSLPPTRPAGRTGTPAVRTDSVTRLYGELRAVDHVSLLVPGGTTVALVGANGAGKSTLLSLVTGRIQPTSGSIEVCGRPLREAGAVASLVGALGHSTMHYDRLTGRENLLLHAALRGLPDGRVDAALDEAELVPAADRAVGTYSHGMRKRLALARCLLHDPAVLVLDEPFSGLDPESGARLSRLLDEVHGERTVLFATHDLERARAHADRVVVLRDGRIVDDRPPPAGPSSTSGILASGTEPVPEIDTSEANLRAAPATRPAGVLRSAACLLRKDLVVEVRTRSASTAVIVLAGLLSLVLGMAFEPLSGDPRAVSGALWVLVVLTAMHGLIRSFDEDFRDDALSGLLLSGADPAGVYLGRVISSSALLLAVAVAASGVVAVLFDAAALLGALPQLLVVLSLTVVGLAAVGTMLTVVARHSRLSETLLPLLVLPLAIPALLAGVESVAALLEHDALDAAWLRVLAFYAVGMLASGTVLFEHVLED